MNNNKKKKIAPTYLNSHRHDESEQKNQRKTRIKIQLKKPEQQHVHSRNVNRYVRTHALYISYAITLFDFMLRR